MDIENYLSLGITDATRKIVFIDTDPQHIKVKIRLKLNARVLEYPKDKLNSYTAINQMNKQASANLNSQARSVISHIQEHNSISSASAGNIKPIIMSGASGSIGVRSTLPSKSSLISK